MPSRGWWSPVIKIIKRTRPSTADFSRTKKFIFVTVSILKIVATLAQVVTKSSK